MDGNGREDVMSISACWVHPTCNPEEAWRLWCTVKFEYGDTQRLNQAPCCYRR